MKFPKLFSLALIVLFHFSVSAQNGLILVKPKGSKKWGFVNLEGNFVINAQYRKVGSFTKDGFAPVIESNAAFINQEGEKLKTEFDEFSISPSPPILSSLSIGTP